MMEIYIFANLRYVGHELEHACCQLIWVWMKTSNSRKKRSLDFHKKIGKCFIRKQVLMVEWFLAQVGALFFKLDFYFIFTIRQCVFCLAIIKLSYSQISIRYRCIKFKILSIRVFFFSVALFLIIKHIQHSISFFVEFYSIFY